MEILAETTHWGIYSIVLFLLIITSLFLLAHVIGAAVELIRLTADKGDWFYGFISALGFGILIGVIITEGSAGPPVTYTAIITDFNVVYEQGYEVIGQDGELYTLMEAR